MSRPTAADRRHWRKISLIGCIACVIEREIYTPAEIHHIKDYGYHNHKKVLPLCPPHHRPTAGIKGVLSIHGQPKEFRNKFGSDEELFERCMQIIGDKA